jgi:hypothetical protein
LMVSGFEPAVMKICHDAARACKREMRGDGVGV